MKTHNTSIQNVCHAYKLGWISIEKAIELFIYLASEGEK